MSAEREHSSPFDRKLNPLERVAANAIGYYMDTLVGPRVDQQRTLDNYLEATKIFTPRRFPRTSWRVYKALHEGGLRRASSEYLTVSQEALQGLIDNPRDRIKNPIILKLVESGKGRLDEKSLLAVARLLRWPIAVFGVFETVWINNQGLRANPNTLSSSIPWGTEPIDVPAW